MRASLIFLTFFCAIGAIYAASLANFETVEDIASFDVVDLHKRQEPAEEQPADEEGTVEEEELVNEEGPADEEEPADPAIPVDPVVPANPANPGVLLPGPGRGAGRRAGRRPGGIRIPSEEAAARRRPLRPVIRLPLCRPGGPRPCLRLISG